MIQSTGTLWMWRKLGFYFYYWGIAAWASQ